jgi:hypothetical protein
MSESSIQAPASAWVRITGKAKFPTDYESTASADVHRASEVIQEQIRGHIVTTHDMHLFSLLHLLGQDSLRLDQSLWPEDYERTRREVEKALLEADDANSKWCSHEEVMQSLRKRIDNARNRPC